MDGRVRVGVLGIGRMGRSHCRVLSLLRHANLIGIHDLDVAAGGRLAADYGIRFFPDVDALLDSTDAVCVAVPTPAHFELSMRCLERGLHVFVEKPITETVQQAELLTQAAESSRLVVQVGHIERFNPAYTELKHVLEEISPVAVSFQRLSPYGGSNVDVDVILDLMIHDLDLVMDLVGEEPTSFWVSGLTAFSGTVDHAVANLRLPTGPLLTVTASRLTEQKVRQIEVTALDAYVLVDLLNKSVAVHRSTVGEYVSNNGQGVRYRQEGVVERIHVPIAEPLFLELQHFVESIHCGMPPLVQARDGLQALRLATTIRDAALESIVDAQILLGAKTHAMELPRRALAGGL